MCLFVKQLTSQDYNGSAFAEDYNWSIQDRVSETAKWYELCGKIQLGEHLKKVGFGKINSQSEKQTSVRLR